jgi:predicted metalloprotease with PDZ domain
VIGRRLLAACLALLCRALAAQVDAVAYTVEYRADVRDRAFVSATLSGKPAGPVEVQIPTWSPGAYELKPFHKRILNLAARDAGGGALAVARVDDLTWRVAETTSWPVTVSYERLDERQGLADGGGPEPRAAGYVGFLPTDTFVYVVGRKEVPHEVRFVLPDGWLSQMALEKGEGEHHYRAPDYDTIVDAPVELGLLTVHRFEVGGAVYSVVLDFRDRTFALLSLEALLRRIVRYQVGMFGGRAPFAAYQFQFHDGPGFGLEHLTSTTLAVPRFLFKQTPGVFDSLYAHEFFHLWNVKRLRPRQLGPFDYTQPVRTKALWFSEGVTDYYADVTCWRTGIWGDGAFLGALQSEIQRLQETPLRLVESVEDASWKAFDRGYAGLDGGNVNYYNKGKLIGLCLDLTIRHQTRGERSLDDVVRGLYEKCALPKPGFDEEQLPKEISDLAGFDLHRFFTKYVSGVDELPFTECLATIGVRCTPGAPDRRHVRRWFERSELAIDGGELFVRRPHSALRAMGLEPGDTILAVNDVLLPQARRPRDLLNALVPAGAGGAVLRVRRDGRIVAVLVSFPPERKWDLELLPDPTPEQRAAFGRFKNDPYSRLVKDGPTLDTVGVPTPRR